MPSVSASIVKQGLFVEFNAAGDDIVSVRVISSLMRDGVNRLGPTVEKSYTKAEALAAGLTATHATNVIGGAEALRVNHSTALLGA